jgi:hypothetical protein
MRGALAILVLFGLVVTVSSSTPILTVPLTRQGSPSARILARATTSTDTQRILHLRSAAAIATTTSGTSAALEGCPFGDFAVPVRINTTSFQLLLDTGSSTLAVAGASCSNCQGVTPLWRPSPGSSINQSRKAISIYGDGSSWSADVWSDRVSLLSSSVNMRIAVIQRQVGGTCAARARKRLAHFPLSPRKLCCSAARAALKPMSVRGNTIACGL